MSTNPKAHLGTNWFTLISNEIIEIPEEAYKKNGVYRPWIEEESEPNSQSLATSSKESTHKKPMNKGAK